MHEDHRTSASTILVRYKSSSKIEVLLPCLKKFIIVGLDCSYVVIGEWKTDLIPC